MVFNAYSFMPILDPQSRHFSEIAQLGGQKQSVPGYGN
jgi:hypothetical protein